MSYSVYTLTYDNDFDVNYLGYSYYLVDASSGNITLSLPTSICWPGQSFIFNRIDSSTNSVTIEAKTNYSINNGSSISLSSHEYTETVNKDGTNWISPKFTYTF